MIRYEQVQTYAEEMPEKPPNSKTGRDEDDMPQGGAETMQINIVDRSSDTTHEGDMGRLGKSE
jgi:hypothetical protein